MALTMERWRMMDSYYVKVHSKDLAQTIEMAASTEMVSSLDSEKEML